MLTSRDLILPGAESCKHDNCGPVYMHDTYSVITVPADVLAPKGARPSAGSVMTANYICSLQSLLDGLWFQICCRWWKATFGNGLLDLGGLADTSNQANFHTSAKQRNLPPQTVGVHCHTTTSLEYKHPSKEQRWYRHGLYLSTKSIHSDIYVTVPC